MLVTTCLQLYMFMFLLIGPILDTNKYFRVYMHGWLRVYLCEVILCGYLIASNYICFTYHTTFAKTNCHHVVCMTEPDSPTSSGGPHAGSGMSNLFIHWQNACPCVQIHLGIWHEICEIWHFVNGYTRVWGIFNDIPISPN